MVDAAAAADLQVDEMSLLLVSAVGGVRPNGVKTQTEEGTHGR